MNLWTDGAEAIRARDAALAQVEVHSAPWRVVAFDALVAVARDRTTLSSEDVWARLAEWGVSPPPEPRAIGPVIVRAVREGVLVHDGYENSTKREHHRDVQSRYRSLVAR